MTTETLSAPSAVVAEHTLYASSQPIDFPADADMEKFGRGLSFWADSCNEAQVVEFCTGLPPDPITDIPGTDEDLEVVAQAGAQDWYPYGIVQDVACGSTGFSAVDWTARVLTGLQAAQDKAMGNTFWTGRGSPEDPNNPGTLLNPHLTRADTTIAQFSGGGDMLQTAETALGAAQALLANSGPGTRGMIHAVPELVSWWVSQGYLEEARGRLVTPYRRDVVVGDPGYTGEGPSGHAQATPPAGYTWVYVTDPVFTHLWEAFIFPDNFEEALSRTRNEVVYRAERLAVAVHVDCRRIGFLVQMPPNDFTPIP